MNKYIGTKTAVYVPTQEDWDRVIKIIRSNYYNDWDICNEYTCLNCGGTRNGHSPYSHMGYYKSKGFKIISVEEFLFESKRSF